MRVAWLKTELLHPIDKGGRIRTYEMLCHLSREHEITYVTLDDGTAAVDASERAREYASRVLVVPHRTATKRSLRFGGELALNLVSALPYAVARYRSHAMRAAVQQLVADGAIDLVVSDFLAISINVPEELAVPHVLFQHNVEAVIWRRHAAVARGAARRAYFHLQWNRMRRFEATMCRRVDRVVAVSADDAAVMQRDYGLGEVSWVPTGVNTERFRPSGAVPRSDHEVVFVGSLDWMPNEDAVSYFVDEILPLVRAEIPMLRLTLVGRRPSPAVRRAALRGGGTICGDVPDVRPFLERAAVMVVPLRVGGGTRLKVFEAMAMETPVLSTTIGAEGLPVEHGTHLRLADGGRSFARELVNLLRDREGRAAMAARAAALVRERFSWGGVAARFAELCDEVRTSPRGDSTGTRADHETRGMHR